MNFIAAIIISICYAFGAKASYVEFGGFWVREDLQIAIMESLQPPESKDKYRTPARVPPLVLRSIRLNTAERSQAVEKCLNLEETPEGKDPSEHRRQQIDETPSRVGKTGARMRRYFRDRDLDPSETSQERREKWFDQYETMQANSQNGRAAEERARDAFHIRNNNVGKPIMIEEGENKRRRADGYAVDDDENTIVAEVKHKKERGVVCATAQIRTEEEHAREIGARHVVIINTEVLAADVENFPRPSRGFRDLTTEFRLISGDGFTFRWNDEELKWDAV